MTLRERMEQMVDEGLLDAETVFFDGLDDALVGLVEHFTPGGRILVAAYDYDACLGLLVERDGMEPEDAEEWMDFNVLGAYVGEGTPAFVHRLSEEGDEGEQCP